MTTVDIIFAFDDYPGEDTKNTARQYTLAAGGPASNAAVVFSYLGGSAQLMSALGNSEISLIARADLVDHGVRHVDIAGASAAPPALSAIAVALRNGSRTIFTSPAIDNESAGPFLDAETSAFVAGSDILLIDGHQPKLAAQLARQAKERGIAVVLDGDLYHSSTQDLLKFVDIAIFGKSFAVPGKASASEVFGYFTAFGIKHVIATNGGRPIEFLSDGVAGSVAVDKVAAVDTLGAGDFFHGAFCYSYCIKRSITEAISFASKVASSSVVTFGTRDWMRDHESTRIE